LRCGGKFNNSFIANFWKNYENRPVIDEVMPKILLVRFFSGHGVLMFILMIQLFRMCCTSGEGRERQENNDIATES